MAAKEIYDYVSTVVPDYSTTALSVNPQKVLVEDVEKNQEVHGFDDGSERVINYDDDFVFHVSLQWGTGISEADAGTILDFFADTSKGNGFARSFKWDHPEDGHTYVVKFRSKLRRRYKAGAATAGYRGVDELKLKVIGRIAD